MDTRQGAGLIMARAYARAHVAGLSERQCIMLAERARIRWEHWRGSLHRVHAPMLAH